MLRLLLADHLRLRAAIEERVEGVRDSHNVAPARAS